MSDSTARIALTRLIQPASRRKAALVAASIGAVLATGLVSGPAHAVNNTTTYDVYPACTGTSDADLLINRVAIAEANSPAGEAVIVNLHVPAATACVVDLADSTVMDGPDPVKFIDLAAGRDITVNGVADSSSSLTIQADPTSTTAAVMIEVPGHKVTLSNLTLAGVGAAATGSAPLVMVTGSAVTLVVDHATLKDNRLAATSSQGAAIDAMLVGDTTVSLDHATVSGNRSGDFGAVAVHSTNDVTVADSVFEHNTAEKAASGGGAINVSTDSGSPSLSVSGSTFNDNQADQYGGAISSTAVAVSISSSTFHANLVPNGTGGAVYMENPSYDAAKGLTIGDSSSFSENIANGDGGAAATYQAPIWVTDSTFGSNDATTGNGGAVFAGGTSSVDTSTFTGNTAGHLAGAVYQDNSDLHIARSEFVDNSAVNAGGAVYDSAGRNDSTIDASTFQGNTAHSEAAATSFGGAVVLEGDGTIKRSTFVGNAADTGGAVNSGGLVTTSTFVGNTTTQSSAFAVQGEFGYGSLFGSIVANDDSGTQKSTDMTDLGANLVTKLPSTGWALTAGETANHSREVTYAALELGSLALNTTAPANAGPTRTVALGSGSVAIDYYTLNPIAPTSVTVDGDASYVQDTDQRNVDRPANGALDVGAYEYYPAAPVGTCTTTTLGIVNFRVDSFELTPAARMKLRAFARKISAAGCQVINLNGHTSGRGSSLVKERIRTKLATNRNAAVRRYLRQQLANAGVTVTIRSHIFNANDPLASNYGPRAAVNRRVQVVMSAL